MLCARVESAYTECDLAIKAKTPDERHSIERMRIASGHHCRVTSPSLEFRNSLIATSLYSCLAMDIVCNQLDR
jgi:hypothetical protein